MDSNYTLAWLIYLGAVAAAQLLIWLPLRRLRFADLRRVIELCVLGLLITPARLEPGSDNWVPAFMAALMELLESGSDAALDRLWPILLVMLLMLVVSMMIRYYLSRRMNNGSGSGEVNRQA